MTLAEALPCHARPSWAVCAALLLPGAAMAQVPAILIEACSQMEPAAKRVECLQAANRATAPSDDTRVTRASRQAAQAQPTVNAFAAPAPSPSPSPSPSARSGNYVAPSGATCYVGPRGGTYTITRSGKKNYGGC